MSTDKLGMAEQPENNTSWYPSYQEIRRVADRLSCGSNEFKVDPDFTDANLGTDIVGAVNRRHFPTIQQAITASESADYTSPVTITLARATYNERLFITKTIKIAGPEPVDGGSLGGGRYPAIMGDGTQNEIINIAPDAGGNACVVLENFYMDNQYAAQSAVIDKAMLIDVLQPASYAAVSIRVTLKGVKALLRTNGDDNQWEYGIRTAGWVDLALVDGTELKATGYAGGNWNGGVKNLIHMRGDAGNGLTSEFYSENSKLYQDYSGAGFPAVIDIADGVTGVCSRSDFWRPGAFVVRNSGGAGTNLITGLQEGELEQYGNQLDVNTIRM